LTKASPQDRLGATDPGVIRTSGVGEGGGGHPYKVYSVENPGKIPENLEKI